MDENKAKLTEKELDKVAGGAGSFEDDDWTTYMQCSACDYKGTMSGRYVSQTFKCPKCGAFAYTGQTYIPQENWG